MQAPNQSSTLRIASEILSAYLQKNKLNVAQLTGLVAHVYAALVRPPMAQEAPALVPAVAIKKSVTPDYIVCLEDGKKFKSLKRHLRTVYSMTPSEYRAKWALPSDYPIVAPSYSQVRSRLAKEIGLGFKRTRKGSNAPSAVRPVRRKSKRKRARGA